jgi:hypothetical protein
MAEESRIQLEQVAELPAIYQVSENLEARI